MSKVKIVIDNNAGKVLCITNDDEKIKDAMYGQLVDNDIELYPSTTCSHEVSTNTLKFTL